MSVTTMFVSICSSSLLIAQTRAFTVSVFPTIVYDHVMIEMFNTDLTGGGVLRAEIIDLTGRRVEDVLGKIAQNAPGVQSIEVDMRLCSAGVYLLVVETPREKIAVKFMRAK